MCDQPSRDSGAGGHPTREPSLDFFLDPSHGASGYLHAHRELTNRLQLVDLGLSETGCFDYLVETQDPDWRTT